MMNFKLVIHYGDYDDDSALFEEFTAKNVEEAIVKAKEIEKDWCQQIISFCHDTVLLAEFNGQFKTVRFI